MKFVSDALNLTPSATKRLEERNILRNACILHPFFPDIEMALKLEKKFGEYEYGTLIVKTKGSTEVIRGYPKIRRALTLHPTISLHFRDEVVIEEKMNGYNVRIAKIGENIYAITRRGFICPYTTEKARDLLSEDFFRDHPSLMLCAEAVGEGSPYVSKNVYDIEDIDFFVFDIREKRTNKPLPIDAKERLSQEYGFKLAEIIDRCKKESAHLVCREIIEELGKEGREGVVIKDTLMAIPPIKYTASQSNAGDLRFAFRYFNDYGKDFMLSRIIREAFQSFEFNESEERFEERCKRLGYSILEPMVKSIEDVSCGNRVAEKHRLRFKSKDVLDLFMAQIRKMGIDVHFHEPLFEDGFYILEFERVFTSTTDKIRNHLSGNLW
jgi:putative ATP-dependent DNA ligase